MPHVSEQARRNLTFWALTFIAVGLPLSVFLVSVGTFVLAGTWLLEGNYAKRLKQFFTSPLSVVLSSVFFVHLIGMAWTADYRQGFTELRLKLPLLLIPLFLFTSSLPSKKRIQEVLLLFVVACVVGTIFGLPRIFEVDGQAVLNSRRFSVFISHIRFGLMLDLAFFILGYYLYSNRSNWSLTSKILSVATMLWLFWFMVILEGFTAYLAFGAMLGTSLVLFLMKRQNTRFVMSISVATLVVSATIGYQVYRVTKNHFFEVPFDYKTLTVKTLNGNYYAHQSDMPYTENGHRIWNFVCWKELRQEWGKRSNMDFEGVDKRGQELKFILIRYMTSKGLLKDSVGVHQLTDQDIKNIEDGFPNYLYAHKHGISRRITELYRGWEKYQRDGDANNSSLFQRLVYAQVGYEIFTEHWLLGVGTGDLRKAYDASYAENDRKLEKRFQGVSHNQFLTVGIMLGIFGLMWFAATLLYTLWQYRPDHLYILFFVLICVSFLTDNTLGTQSGVTLFAFFNTLLIIRKELEEKID